MAHSGPVGFVSVALFWLTWPGAEQLPTLQRRRWREFDALGSLLIIAASTLVVFAFQNAGESFGTIWAQAVFIAPLVLGICCWIALLLWGNLVLRRFGDRIALVFPVNLFRNRVYASAALSTLLLGFPYLLLLFSFPLREQAVSGKSALTAGLMLLPMLGTTALGSVIVGKINTTRNYLFESLLAGAALMLLACGLLTLVSGPGDDPKALGFLTFAGLGFGLSTSAATMIAAVEAPIKDYGEHSSSLACECIGLKTDNSCHSTCTRDSGSAAHLGREFRNHQLISVCPHAVLQVPGRHPGAERQGECRKLREQFNERTDGGSSPSLF